MSKRSSRIIASLVVFLPLATGLVAGAFAQESPTFASGNLVVVVEGCGVQGGTCSTLPNGTGTGVGNSSEGGYGDNEAGPLTLFQFTQSGAFINSLVLPQTSSGANLPVSGEYGSSSEGDAATRWNGPLFDADGIRHQCRNVRCCIPSCHYAGQLCYVQFEQR